MPITIVIDRLFRMNVRPHVNRRKLKLSVGDIYLDSRKAKPDIKPTHKKLVSDPFLSYKESCSLLPSQGPSQSSATTKSLSPSNSNGGCVRWTADRTGTNWARRCVRRR